MRELKGHYTSITMLGGIDQVGSISVKEKGEHIWGYDCDVVTATNRDHSRTITICYLSGSNLSLRQESLSAGVVNSISTTTKIETGAVPDDVFVPPAGIEAVFNQAVDEKAISKIKKLVEILKKPDGLKGIMQPTDSQR